MCKVASMLYGNCLTESLVYRGEVKYHVNNLELLKIKPDIYYVGLTCNSFKVRHEGQKTSLNNPAYRKKAPFYPHTFGNSRIIILTLI